MRVNCFQTRSGPMPWRARPLSHCGPKIRVLSAVFRLGAAVRLFVHKVAANSAPHSAASIKPCTHACNCFRTGQTPLAVGRYTSAQKCSLVQMDIRKASPKSHERRAPMSRRDHTRPRHRQAGRKGLSRSWCRRRHQIMASSKSAALTTNIIKTGGDEASRFGSPCSLRQMAERSARPTRGRESVKTGQSALEAHRRISARKCSLVQTGSRKEIPVSRGTPTAMSHSGHILRRHPPAG
jgi:hypothetical protein